MTWIENNPIRMALISSLSILFCGAVAEFRHDSLSWGYLLWSPAIFMVCFGVGLLSKYKAAREYN